MSFANIFRPRSARTKVVFSVALFFFLVIGLEVGCGLLNSRKQMGQPHVTYTSPEGKSYYGEFYEDDEAMGYRPKSNYAFTCIAQDEKQTIYKATYHTDEYHRRITPVDGVQARANFLVF